MKDTNQAKVLAVLSKEIGLKIEEIMTKTGFTAVQVRGLLRVLVKAGKVRVWQSAIRYRGNYTRTYFLA